MAVPSTCVVACETCGASIDFVMERVVDVPGVPSGVRTVVSPPRAAARSRLATPARNRRAETNKFHPVFPGDPRLQRALQEVADAEGRVARQQRLILHMKKRNLRTTQAEDLLRALNASLLYMRNHLDLVVALITPPKQRR